MFSALVRKLFGSANDRMVTSMQQTVTEINRLEAQIAPLSDEQLQAKTAELKMQLQQGKTLDDILPVAFAVAREAAKRTLGMRHFDVQLIGGITMHHGMIAEMKTGEGKTLAATLPAYLNALTGKGVHVVTVNDYLVERDATWMSTIYTFLGLTVGYITGSVTDEERKHAYQCDITYGTNNEFGFDFLRDNLKFNLENKVQRDFHYAIVDEVDSILIDEARTPLIISGPAEDNVDLYLKVNKIIPHLEKEDYELDEKNKNCILTDKGHEKVEELLHKFNILSEGTGLYDTDSILVLHHLNQALRAHKVYHKDVDYLINDNKVMIIDEFTGRVLEGRRYSEGLHQALEAKEGVPIQRENQTLAAITFQNYFRMYNKLAGMTGTAFTEEKEFLDIYKLQPVSIPTNMQVQRIDEDDCIFKTMKEKYDAIVEQIKECYTNQQPILVGTISIEKSEFLASLLKKAKIPHNILNAKYHAQEAEIIAQAGRLGSVTIATNMAGRGTDIMLGGNPEMLLKQQSKASPNANIEQLRTSIAEQLAQEKEKVKQLGGLFVLCTERHEARRIDDQLRGRSGRQGDPGRTRFYLSLEDDLMRVFGSEKIAAVLTRLGLKDGDSIVHPWISRSVEKAQKRVEMRNYEMRKTLLKFDDVMNQQRSVVYAQRKEIMLSNDLMPYVHELYEELNSNLVSHYIPQGSLPEQWNIASFDLEVTRIYGIHGDFQQFAQSEGIAEMAILQKLNADVQSLLEDKITKYGNEPFHKAAQHVMLMTLDQHWKEHLHNLDHLRTGISLRAYAQKDPLNEYKIEAFNLFKQFLNEYKISLLQRISHLQINSEAEMRELNSPKNTIETREEFNEELFNANKSTSSVRSTQARNPHDPSTWGKIARNELCPCGSGKKYKHCHGMLAA